MSEQIVPEYVPELSEHVAQAAAESPTLGKILYGQVPMRPLDTGHSFDYQEGQLGQWRTYEVTIPGARPDGSDWPTYLSRWERLPLVTAPYQRPAAERVTILTGQGQMPFAQDPEVVKAVTREMRRQENLFRAQEAPAA